MKKAQVHKGTIGCCVQISYDENVRWMNRCARKESRKSVFEKEIIFVPFLSVSFDGHVVFLFQVFSFSKSFSLHFLGVLHAHLILLMMLHFLILKKMKKMMTLTMTIFHCL